ncbi:MAG: DNA primase [Acidobacteriota bacterium]|nr:DNA primase [Acidobacteriota bacterium]
MVAASFRDYLESVRSAVDIADVVGESVTLRKAGHSLVGLCPFHQEKTPSFRVDRDKGLFYCFGCQAGGDVFTFVKTIHGLEFPDAVKLLGDRLGIPRPSASSKGEARAAKRRQRLLDAVSAAHAFYRERLDHATDGEAARGYLATRGLSAEQAGEFGLGVAPAGWDGALRHLSARGYAVDELVAAGLVVPRRRGDGVYDRFRERLVFPIRDSAGRVVSFGGRALGSEDPKYLNGPECEIYDKSGTLFRLSETIHEIRKSERAVVVEGYFDAVALAVAGIPGVVAVCGTALGPRHAKLLKRFTSRVVLLLDGDRAGRRAARRALGPLLGAGLSVRVAFPPDGADPDDLVRDEGADAVRAVVAGALELPDFLLEEARREFDLQSIDGRVEALAMVLEHLVPVTSEVARAEAIARVADGLGIEDDLVRDELRKAARERRTRLAPVVATAASRPVPSRISRVERDLIRYLFECGDADPEEADRVAARIPLEQLSACARALVKRWLDTRRSAGTPDLTRLADAVADDEKDEVLRIAFADGSPPELAEAEGCIDALRERELKRRLRDVQKTIEKAQDADQIMQLMGEKLSLARELEELRSASSPRTTS